MIRSDWTFRMILAALFLGLAMTAVGLVYGTFLKGRCQREELGRHQVRAVQRVPAVGDEALVRRGAEEGQGVSPVGDEVTKTTSTAPHAERVGRQR